VACAARKLQALYPQRPTDGIVPRTVKLECLESRSQWRMHRLTFNARSVSKPLCFSNLTVTRVSLGGGPEQNNSTQNTSTVTALKHSPPSSGWDRLHHRKLTRMSNVRARFRIRPKNMRLTSHCRAESRAAQVRLATLFAFHGAVRIIARSSPTHCLERRLVRFLRLHRATLCCADFRV